MKTTTKTIEELIQSNDSPLPLHVIPNYMGINLLSVSHLEWIEEDDGQMKKLTINFIPKPKIDLEWIKTEQQRNRMASEVTLPGREFDVLLDLAEEALKSNAEQAADSKE